MKLSAKTIEILANFSLINQSMLFLEGKTQKTMKPTGTVIGSVEIDEDIPQEFGIHDLPKFLSLLSLFKDPDIEFNDNSKLIITEGKTKASFVYCDAAVIKHPPRDKEIVLKDVVISFELANETFQSILKASKVLATPNLVIEGDGSEIRLVVKDLKNSSSDTLSRVVGETEDVFSFNFDVSVFNLLPHDYDVEIDKKVAQFTSKKFDLKYFVAVQK